MRQDCPRWALRAKQPRGNSFGDFAVVALARRRLQKVLARNWDSTPAKTRTILGVPKLRTRNRGISAHAAGTYAIAVGGSSRDLPLQTSVRVVDFGAQN
jgi:hypothetical protein